MLRWVLFFTFIFTVGCEHMSEFFKMNRSVVDVDAKRPGDDRIFRSISLDNKLTVLLISDPSLNKSAAAMDVGVGSLSDPENHVGLAHFLEHMLFLGTKKYPEVEEYSQYLSKYQGQSNAFTDEEDTNYYFEVNHDGFEGALDRFAQFFISPLFNQEFVERELHAVDSEHQKNLKNDSWRTRRVFQLLHKEGHPRQKFGTGNVDTLQTVDTETLIAFYKKHYSANLMKLALMSPLSLDEMEKMVREKFASVPNFNYERPHFDSEIFASNQLPRLVQVKSVKKLHRLELAFAIPSELAYWESKPAAAVSHLMGYEGEGSLLSLLKKEGLASKLEAGVESSTYTSTFHFDIELTEKGLEQWQQVIEHFFAYVNLLKKEGYKKYIYDERKVMADIDYVYREPREGGNVVSDYAGKMQIYPPLLIDRHDHLIFKYSTEDFNHFLSFVKPEKLNLFLISDKAKTDQTEKFYGVTYKQEALPKALTEKLQKVALDPRLSLPKPNPFIPEKLQVIATQQSTQSKKIIDNEWGTFWFQLDDTFKLPKASLRLLLMTLRTNASAYDKMMAQLYSEAINESLNEWAYTISLAGLHLDISQSDRGIQLDITGYSEKLPQLLNDLSERLTNITIDKVAFDDIKTDLKRRIANTTLNSAYWQTLYELRYISNKTMIHNYDYFNPIGDKGVDLISPVTFDELKGYAKDLFKEIAIEGAAYGNLEEKELKNSIMRFTTALDAKVLAENKRPKEEIVNYPAGSDLSVVRQSLTNNNSWGVNVQFGRRDLKLNAAIRIGHAHLQTSFYTDLRTKQQLGYIVASSLSIHEKVLGLLFLVQSANFSPFDIAQRAEVWMKGAIRELEGLSEEEFMTYKQAVIQELQEKDKTIQEKLETLYFEGITMKGHFHYKDDVVRAANTLTKNEMLDIFRRALTSKDRSTLSVYFSTEKNSKEKVSGTPLLDVKKFKSQAPVFN